MEITDTECYLDQLKLILKNPHGYLWDYFADLKREVDLEFLSKNMNEQEEENEQYLEIIDAIKLFEQETYNNLSKLTLSSDVFYEEIESIEEWQLFVSLYDPSMFILEIMKSIDKLKFKIEKTLFLNRSIFFLKNYGNDKKTFLLILNDEYRKKFMIDDFIDIKFGNEIQLNGELKSFKIECVKYRELDINKKIINNEKIIAIILFKKISEMIKNDHYSQYVISIGIKKMEQFIFEQQKITILDSETFNGLSNLSKISLSLNRIKTINPGIFNELTRLKEIDFNSNEIQVIHPSLFNGLNNLERIIFYNNRIEQINENTFNGLISLKEIDFASNQIDEIHPKTFNGLNNLEIIDFNDNIIKEIHENTFNKLINLKEIDFSHNEIQQLNPIFFNELTKLENIDFSKNKIKEIHSSLFNGLNNLERIIFYDNRIEEINEHTFNGLINLKVIDISTNKIKAIPSKTFDGLMNLEKLNF